MSKDLSVFTDEAVDAIFERDDDRCAKCGMQWDRDYGRSVLWSIHHRKARGSGGSKKNPTIGDVSNGIIACGHGTIGCHRAIETFRADSMRDGFLVSRNGVRHAWEVPIKHAVHGWCLLTRDGKWEPYAPEKEAA